MTVRGTTNLDSLELGGNLTVTGTQTITGNVTYAGDVTLGDAAADTITINGTATFNTPVDVLDVAAGGAANGSLVKKQLQAGEAYTTTTAGLMVKNYGEATATVPSGEYTGLYVNLKGLHTDPGNNTSLISAHVHASNTTTVHAGLWLYGDMTNGVKASGSTLTTMVDISQATAVTNLVSLPALSTAPVSGQTEADYTFTKYAKIAILIGGATYYLIADTTA